MGLYNDHKLHCKAKEEEEVEFQKSDVDLKRQISPLHSKVGRDVFVDGPRKFIVELPRCHREEDAAERQDARYGNEEWLCLAPDCVACSIEH